MFSIKSVCKNNLTDILIETNNNVHASNSVYTKKVHNIWYGCKERSNV